MIVIRMWGGIGNQLFQYSFGEYLRLRTAQEVKYDISSFGRIDKLRKFELEMLNYDIPIVENIRFSNHKGLLNRMARLFFSLKRKNKFVSEFYFSENLLSNINANGILYLQGYWQNAMYPNELLKNNSAFFSPCIEKPIEIQIIENEIKISGQSIALHVRRGDYFYGRNIKELAVCDSNYFHKALQIMEDQLKNYKLFVFSDDLDWVQKNLKLPEGTYYVPVFKVNSFWFIYLMSCCSHNIISNSSFSWWGAYLNQNKDKMIISPKKWIHNSDKQVALPEWIKL